MKTRSFPRRTIGIAALIRDTLSLIRDQKQIRRAMRNEKLPEPFRERLMLAVTAVNKCRYCSYAHSRTALTAGLSGKEISELCGGVYDSCPPEQVPALLYAEHWAESDGKPDEEVRRNVVDQYGETLLADIEVVLRMIRMGNMMGNAWDYFVFRLSFGRWGACETEGTATESRI
ncbi:MAG: carboxymuconolactone decarboxylase family protein [Anaerolineales bacterium]|nr:carboxymuconolactone decarboxylase family protein [Anaerolineales bacterium]